MNKSPAPAGLSSPVGVRRRHQTTAPRSPLTMSHPVTRHREQSAMIIRIGTHGPAVRPVFSR
jgi:hypothetical protein